MRFHPGRSRSRPAAAPAARVSTMRAALPMCAAMLSLGLAAAPAFAADLQIRLCGMRNHNGGLRITVFSRAAAAEFTNAESKAWSADRTESLAGRDWGPMTVTIPLAPGDYAVRVIHDENGNGILDRDGWLTTPTESYGYSRNVRARVTAVEFDEAFVTLSDEPLEIDIRVAPWSLSGGDDAPCPKK
jgi:uncharacterized protein (DUF2141 family)